MKRSSDSSALLPFIFPKKLSALVSFFTIVATLSACNPNSTKIGTNFYSGIYVSVDNSLITVSSATVVSGSSVTLTLHLKDTNYNPFVSTLPVVAFTAVGGTSTGLIGAVTNNHDGTYQASFTGLTTGTATTIHATVDGSEVASSLPTITVTSGSFSLSNSLLTLSAASVLITNTVTATLTVYDAANNPLTAGGLTVVFSNSGGTSSGTWGATTDVGNGTYTAVFTSTTSGTATTVSASISGSAITSALPTLTVTGVASSVPASLAAASTPGSVALTWAASTGTAPITYTVKRATVTGGPYTTLQSGIAVTNYTDATVANGTTYYYVVSSTNAVGTSADSSEVSTRPIAAFTISAVSVNNTASSLEISWGAATGAAAYTLKYGTATGVYGTTVSTTATSPTTVGSLTPGTTYYFMVVATNAVGAGTGVNATAESTGIPMAAFTMTAATRASTSSSVTWAASAGSTSYTLKYGTATGVYGTTFSTAATSATNVTGLTAGTTYYFRVTAVNGSGSLDSTAELSQTTLAAFSNTWPFDAAPDPTLTYSFDGTKIDFTGGVCRLTGTDQVDDDNAASGFAGGTLLGAASFDSTNSYIRLNTSSSNLELDSSWAPAWPNLIGYWKINESAGTSGANSIVDTIGSYPGTPNGTITFGASGKLNSAGTFDGTSGYILTSNPAALQLSNGTVSAWIKTANAGASYRAIAAKANAYGLFLIDNTLAIYDWGAVVARNTNINLADNSWHHVAVTFRSGVANGTQIYIDGISRLTTTMSVMDQTKSFSIGENYGCGPTCGQKFAGTIDDVAVWNTPLSNSAIASIYEHEAATHTGTLISRVMDAFQTGMSWTTLSWIPTLPFMKELPDYASGAIQNESSTDYSSLVGANGSTGDNNLMSGIVGLWHLNEAAATAGANNDFKDDSGSGFFGETVGGVTIGTAGQFDKAVLLNGTSGYINFGSSNIYNLTASFTLAAWIRRASSGRYDSIIQRYDENSPWSGYGLRFSNGAGEVDKICLWTGGATGTWMCSATTVTDQKWHFITATWDGTTRKVFIDGIQSASDTQVSNLSNSGDTLFVGSAGGIGNFFSGSIDEVSIWSRALHANEIKQLYRRGANRLKHQVRVCTSADCSDDSTGANWKGPDGTNQTYFSELNNNTVALDGSGDVRKELPSMLFSAFTSPVGTSRYFQYRTILESDDTGTGCDYGSGATWCSPELKSVTVDPVHYDSSSPTVIGKTGVSFYSLATYAETLGASCASGVGYNLGVGAAYSSATWYYWSGAAWVAANGTAAQSNTAAVVSTNAASFSGVAGTGTVYFKAFLQSSGTSKCELDKIDLTGQQ